MKIKWKKEDKEGKMISVVIEGEIGYHLYHIYRIDLGNRCLNKKGDKFERKYKIVLEKNETCY